MPLDTSQEGAEMIHSGVMFNPCRPVELTQPQRFRLSRHCLSAHHQYCRPNHERQCKQRGSLDLGSYGTFVHPADDELIQRRFKTSSKPDLQAKGNAGWITNAVSVRWSESSGMFAGNA